MTDAVELYLDLLKRAVTNSIYQDQSFVPRIDPRTKRLGPYVPQPYDEEDRRIGHGVPAVAHTMIGGARLDSLHACLNQVRVDRVEGDLIEAGVWRGGACIFMRGFLRAHHDTRRTVWLADSFAGFPVTDESGHPYDVALSLHDGEHPAAALDTVRGNFRRYGLLDAQVRFLAGWFEETLPRAPIDRLALIRLDGDLYASTLHALTNLYPKLSRGGFVIVDDFDWDGCRDAVEEFRAGWAIKDPVQYISPGRAAGAFWRRMH